MKINKANGKRLASLSVLSAAALGVHAGNAEASSIVYSGILDEPVGYGSGGQVLFFGPNGVGGLLAAYSRTSPQHSAIYGITLKARHGAHGTAMLFMGAVHSTRTFAWGQRPGAVWDRARCVPQCRSLSKGLIDLQSSIYGQYPKFSFTAFHGARRYLLFEFIGGDLGATLYGWAQLNVTLSSGRPDAALIDWAYDSSGAQLPAGDTGVPEPSTFALTGLAALALGAKGVRHWRAARKTAGASAS